MPRLAVRLVALLLLPCLIADPVSASAFLPTPLSGQHLVQRINPRFDEEALSGATELFLRVYGDLKPRGVISHERWALALTGSEYSSHIHESEGLRSVPQQIILKMKRVTSRWSDRNTETPNNWGKLNEGVSHAEDLLDSGDSNSALRLLVNVANALSFSAGKSPLREQVRVKYHIVLAYWQIYQARAFLDGNDFRMAEIKLHVAAQELQIADQADHSSSRSKLYAKVSGLLQHVLIVLDEPYRTMQKMPGKPNELITGIVPQADNPRAMKITTFADGLTQVYRINGERDLRAHGWSHPGARWWWEEFTARAAVAQNEEAMRKLPAEVKGAVRVLLVRRQLALVRGYSWGNPDVWPSALTGNVNLRKQILNVLQTTNGGKSIDMGLGLAAMEMPEVFALRDSAQNGNVKEMLGQMPPGTKVTRDENGVRIFIPGKRFTVEQEPLLRVSLLNNRGESTGTLVMSAADNRYAISYEENGIQISTRDPEATFDYVTVNSLSVPDTNKARLRVQASPSAFIVSWWDATKGYQAFRCPRLEKSDRILVARSPEGDIILAPSNREARWAPASLADQIRAVLAPLETRDVPELPWIGYERSLLREIDTLHYSDETERRMELSSQDLNPVQRLSTENNILWKLEKHRELERVKKTGMKAVLAMPVTTLILPFSLLKALKARKIATVGQLAALTEADILAMGSKWSTDNKEKDRPRMGQYYMVEVKKVLYDLDIKWGTQPEPSQAVKEAQASPESRALTFSERMPSSIKPDTHSTWELGIKHLRHGDESAVPTEESSPGAARSSQAKLEPAAEAIVTPVTEKKAIVAQEQAAPRKTTPAPVANGRLLNADEMNPRGFIGLLNSRPQELIDKIIAYVQQLDRAGQPEANPRYLVNVLDELSQVRISNAQNLQWVTARVAVLYVNWKLQHHKVFPALRYEERLVAENHAEVSTLWYIVQAELSGKKTAFSVQYANSTEMNLASTLQGKVVHTKDGWVCKSRLLNVRLVRIDEETKQFEFLDQPSATTAADLGSRGIEKRPSLDDENPSSELGSLHLHSAMLITGLLAVLVIALPVYWNHSDAILNYLYPAWSLLADHWRGALFGLLGFSGVGLYAQGGKRLNSKVGAGLRIVGIAVGALAIILGIWTTSPQQTMGGALIIAVTLTLAFPWILGELAYMPDKSHDSLHDIREALLKPGEIKSRQELIHFGFPEAFLPSGSRLRVREDLTGSSQEISHDRSYPKSPQQWIGDLRVVAVENEKHTSEVSIGLFDGRTLTYAGVLFAETKTDAADIYYTDDSLLQSEIDDPFMNQGLSERAIVLLLNQGSVKRWRSGRSLSDEGYRCYERMATNSQLTVLHAYSDQEPYWEFGPGFVAAPKNQLPPKVVEIRREDGGSRGDTMGHHDPLHVVRAQAALNGDYLLKMRMAKEKLRKPADRSGRVKRNDGQLSLPFNQMAAPTPRIQESDKEALLELARYDFVKTLANLLRLTDHEIAYEIYPGPPIAKGFFIQNLFDGFLRLFKTKGYELVEIAGVLEPNSNDQRMTLVFSGEGRFISVVFSLTGPRTWAVRVEDFGRKPVLWGQPIREKDAAAHLGTDVLALRGSRSFGGSVSAVILGLVSILLWKIVSMRLGSGATHGPIWMSAIDGVGAPPLAFIISALIHTGRAIVSKPRRDFTLSAA